jgi:hypothetical protein
MKKHSFFIIILCLFTLYSCSKDGTEKDLKIQSGISAAKAWLQLMDKGEYYKTWETASSLFQNAIDKEKWVKKVKPVREPFGKIISRKIKKYQYLKALPGAPDGEYVYIQFQTSFEKKRASIETITPMLDADGIWKVSGYYVK